MQALPLSKQIELSIKPSPIQVNSNQAHYLTLVINELATNTPKHALQNQDVATIEVIIQQDDQNVMICFCDDGPGYPQEMLQLSSLLDMG